MLKVSRRQSDANNPCSITATLGGTHSRNETTTCIPRPLDEYSYDTDSSVKPSFRIMNGNRDHKSLTEFMSSKSKSNCHVEPDAEMVAG